MKRILQIVIAFFVSCQDIKRPPLYTLFLFSNSPDTIGVISSDFGSAGRFNVFQPSLNSMLPGEVPIHSDAVARFGLGRVFVVNRLNKDSIQILNPELFFFPEREFSLGQGSNPQDIAILSPNKAYVPLFNSPRILIIQPSLGVILGEINLAQYAERTSAGLTLDGNPELSSAFIYNDRLFVTAQRLDRNSPEGFFPPSSEPSLLIEIDTSTDQVVATYEFQSKNPIGFPQVVNVFGDDYAVFCSANRLGFLSRLDGGIEAFNLRARSFRPGFLLSETSAGGDILATQILNAEVGYASVLTASFEKRVIRFQPSTGAVTSVLLSIPGSVGVNLSGLTLTSEGRLYVGNMDLRSPSILIFDPAGNRTINTNLPPAGFLQLQENLR